MRADEESNTPRFADQDPEPKQIQEKLHCRKCFETFNEDHLRLAIVGDKEIIVCKACEHEAQIDFLEATFDAKGWVITGRANVSGCDDGNNWSGMELTFTPPCGSDMKVIIKELKQ